MFNRLLRKLAVNGDAISYTVEHTPDKKVNNWVCNVHIRVGKATYTKKRVFTGSDAYGPESLMIRDLVASDLLKELDLVI